MTTRHCRDPHCANFATGDSDWCRKHGPEHLAEIPLADWERQIQSGLLGGQPQSEAFAHFHDGPEPVLAADEHRRLLATGKVHPDGRVEKSFVNPHIAGTHDLQPAGYGYPDTAGRHCKDQPRRRRSWRHPIRGVVQ